MPGRKMMAEFSLFLIFAGVMGLTYSLLSLFRFPLATPDGSAERDAPHP